MPFRSSSSSSFKGASSFKSSPSFKSTPSISKPGKAWSFSSPFSTKKTYKSYEKPVIVQQHHYGSPSYVPVPIVIPHSQPMYGTPMVQQPQVMMVDDDRWDGGDILALLIAIACFGAVAYWFFKKRG